MSLSKGHSAFGTLGIEIQKAIQNDYDAKILITSHNSKPGLGKTTLAIRMARAWDQYGWSAQEKGFLDIYAYHDAYLNKEPGSVLVFDEIEGEADTRRAMSGKNVDLSQAWAQQRFRNMITIATLPTVSMLDKRLLELSDYWINVVRRGRAHPYRILVNDFTGKPWRSRIDEDAVIHFDDLPEDDEDYQYLKERKAENSHFDRTYHSESEVENKLEKREKEIFRETRNSFIEQLVTNADMTYDEIAELDVVDVSPRRVGQIARDS